MDKTIRGADKVVCPKIIPPNTSAMSNTLVVVRESKYTRYKFIPSPITGSSANGQILTDNPEQPDPNVSLSAYRTFSDNVCTDQMGTDSPNLAFQVLTDTDLQTGVSVESAVENGFFTRVQQSGFKDTVTVAFKLAPAIQASSAVAGQIDAVDFKTTVQLR